MINVSLHGIIFQLICIIKGVRESRAYLFAFYAEKKTILRMNYVKRLTCRLICILHCLHVCAGAPQVTCHLNFDQSWPYRHSMFDSPYFHYICNGVMAEMLNFNIFYIAITGGMSVQCWLLAK